MCGEDVGCGTVVGLKDNVYHATQLCYIELQTLIVRK